MAWHDHLPRLHKHLGEEEQDLIVGCRNHKPMGEMRQGSAYPSPRTNLPPSSSSPPPPRYGRSVYRALTEDQHLGPYTAHMSTHQPARRDCLSVSRSLPPSLLRPPSPALPLVPSLPASQGKDLLHICVSPLFPSESASVSLIDRYFFAPSESASVTLIDRIVLRQLRLSYSASARQPPPAAACSKTCVCVCVCVFVCVRACV